ncbi:endonuclease domain-containing protein [Streptomyces antibioticus]|uniref:endonuclease domain-containing protein n=1 Tax=Streptomyces antibioticus TaxID=1890 RepID=UPI00338F3CC5
MAAKKKPDLNQPACWGWKVDGQAVENARYYATAPNWGSHAARFETVTFEILRWQGLRCAICGRRHSQVKLVRDHDHNTEPELFRGWLCDGCNRAEGRRSTRHPRYQGYRERSPAVMLGVEIEHHDSFRRGPSRADLRRLLAQQAELHVVVQQQRDGGHAVAESTLSELLANHSTTADALRHHAV